MTFRQQLDNTKVPPAHLAIAWLGQNSFIIKTPAGAVITIDPYLTNSCAALAAKDGYDMDRRFPPPLLPGELVGIDGYVLTHSHQDHLDPDTLAGYRAAGGNGPWFAPAESVEKLRSLGVAADHIQMVWPNRVLQIGDLTLRTTFAIPFAGDDLTHVGYILSVADGPVVYFTGDTSYEPILHLATAAYKPTVLVSVINGGFRNMSPADAAELALRLDVQSVIPCHHDLFADNCQPPQMLHTNLKNRGIGDRYLLLERGQPTFFDACGKRRV